MVLYRGLSLDVARHYQAGGADAYDLAPERVISEGAGNPCRHCLKTVPDGDEMLILAHRPFGSLQPYAETGPIFLCAEACDRFESDVLPPVLMRSPQYLIKGYTVDERISYGTGAIVAQSDLENSVSERLNMPHIAFVDIRSASNNCWQARARKG
ncbi:MAG: DUF1203 domain-containing protein [Pelagimonas sp.]|uniref:DUF1203 domain-containing protein n=1 Tax=Pelagimonas sp. TaxID=2073170 RepID=UPI003D6A20AC